MTAFGIIIKPDAFVLQCFDQQNHVDKITGKYKIP